MSLKLLFRVPNQNSNHRPRPARTRRSFPLRLTALEDRTVLSAFTVTSLGDSGSGTLRAGVASGANVIQFASGLHGTIKLASEIDITSSLKIQGPGADEITVSGNHVTRVFAVDGSNTSLSIAGLTIANGFAAPTTYAPGLAAFGGGLLNNGANVSLLKDVFVGNQAGDATTYPTTYAAGGAIANIGGAQLTANQINFSANTASTGGANFGNGGAVDDDQSSIVDIKNSTFVDNFATGGNANGGAIGHYDNSRLTVANSSFSGNHVLVVYPYFGSGAGGAIQTDNGGSAGGGFFGTAGQTTVSIANCSFTGNYCTASLSPAGQLGGAATGGALDLEFAGMVTVSNSTFVSNYVVGGAGGNGGPGMDGGAGNVGKGGAIFNNTGTLTISNSQFLGNQAIAGNGGNRGNGGGNGGAPGYSNGGAINSTAGQDDPVVPVTTIRNSQFIGNLSLGGSGGAGGSGGNGADGARGDGGGVISFFGTLTVSNCSLANNTAQGGAGGAPGSGGVGGNGGLGRSGGLGNERGSTGTVTNTSISDNQAIGGLGGAGGSGGNAIGAGVYNGREAGAYQSLSNGFYAVQEATLELVNCSVASNLALGGAGGVGGNGGFASGGGIYNGSTDAAGNPVAGSFGSPTLDLDGTDVTLNAAIGGAAAAGGVAGAGVGGGLYNDSLNGSVAQVDSHSKIRGNIASTSDDDIFGIITPI
jgi:hypothetical protein